MSIPKPQHCRQEWLGMKPAGGGRICGKCSKLIVDFSGMSWAEIEHIQSANNNEVCGMYNPQQLDHWGKEVPTGSRQLAKAVGIVSLTLSFSVSTYGQDNIAFSDSIRIEGRLTDRDTKDNIPFAEILLKNRNLQTRTDENGNFRLEFLLSPEDSQKDTLEVRYFGYHTLQLPVEDMRMKSEPWMIELESDNTVRRSAAGTKISTYYVLKPSLGQRIRWRFKNWFGK